MAKRLLFIDVAKGSAILGVVLVHALVHGVWFFPSYALDVLPPWLLGVLGPLVILATWAGFFELMSGLSNGYNMYDRLMVRKQSFKKASQGPLVNSTGLLIMHFVFVIFFSHRRNAPYPDVYSGEINSMISGSLEQGTFHFTDFQFFFFADVLGSIALAGYLSILLMWVLYKTRSLENVQKSYKILLLFAIGFFIISYPIWDMGYGLVVELLQDGTPGALAMALPLSMLTGAFQPFFPIAGFGIIGVILGILLSVENHREEEPQVYHDQEIPTAKGFIKLISPMSFLVFVAFLGILINEQRNPLSLFDQLRLPPTLLALNLSLMLGVIYLGIKIFEDPDEETRQRRAAKTTVIRRFGMVTLSVYTFESVINGIVSFQFHRLYDDPTTVPYESHVATIPIFAYLLIVFSFWFTFVYYWEKVNFKYGIEYWVIKIGSKFRSTKSAKLDVSRVLHNPLGKKTKQEEDMIPAATQIENK